MPPLLLGPATGDEHGGEWRQLRGGDQRRRVVAAGFGVSSDGRLEGREAPRGQGADERAIPF
jgi:hypothetical protein